VITRFGKHVDDSPYIIEVQEGIFLFNHHSVTNTNEKTKRKLLSISYSSFFFSSTAADSEKSEMLKYMFLVQARTKSGRIKKKGGDKFEVIINGPEVLNCIHTSTTFVYKNQQNYHSINFFQITTIPYLIETGNHRKCTDYRCKRWFLFGAIQAFQSREISDQCHSQWDTDQRFPLVHHSHLTRSMKSSEDFLLK
jgi:hypothetical protein